MLPSELSCHVCIECKTDGMKTFGTCLFLVLVSKFLHVSL